MFWSVIVLLAGTAVSIWIVSHLARDIYRRERDRLELKRSANQSEQ